MFNFNTNKIFKEIDEYLTGISEEETSSVCIGYISFDDAVNEQEIGRPDFKSIGKCKVEVYNNEGPIPHMHVYNADNSFKTCIYIFENKYFIHGKYKDKFNNKQCKQFNEWIIGLNESGKLNWDIVVNAWKRLNGNVLDKYKNITTPPNYSKIL